MSCTHMSRNAGPAPLWHRAICRDCRKGRGTDALVGFALNCRKAGTAPPGLLPDILTALDLPHSMPRPRRDTIRAFVRRAKRPAAITAASLTILGFGYTRYIDIDPNVRIPTPVLSGPNAFDDFERAAALLKDDKLIGEMLAPPNPAKPGAGSAGSMDVMGVSARRPNAGVGKVTVWDQPHVYTLGEKEELLLQNEPAFKAIRAGLNHPYLAPPLRTFYAPLDYLAHFRSLARLLRFEAETAAAHGDWARVARTALDAVELGVKVQTSRTVPGKGTGTACESIGRDSVWNAVDHLSAWDARAAARRLEAIAAAKPTTSETLAEEKWYVMAGLQNLMRKPGWRAEWSSGAPQAALYIQLLPYSKTRLLRLAEQRLDASIAEARAPYVPPSARLPREAADSPYILQMLIPFVEGIRFRDEVDSTENGLLTAALALRAYKLDHGRYPTSLERLAQGYVRSLPRDPFTQGEVLRYRLTKRGYVLYGLGPDGVDNAGQPIRNAPENNIPYVVQNSSGDIVAGINKH